MDDISGDIGIEFYIKNFGFQNTRIISFAVVNEDLEIRVQDLYANSEDQTNRSAPGFILIRNCKGFKCDGLVSDWVLDGQVRKSGSEISLILHLNSGSIFEATGLNVEIHEEMQS